MHRIVFIIAGVLLGISLAAILSLSQFASSPPAVHGTLIDPPAPMPDFALSSGPDVVRKSQFEGRIVVVAFGYTYCPDVCPTTMSRLAQAVALLGDDAERVQVLLVSVDPERDTPERVRAYAERFNPAFVGLSGRPDQIAEVTAAFGIHHERGEETEERGYLVDHTATVTALDAEGNTRLLWSFDVAPEQIAHDLRYLIGTL